MSYGVKFGKLLAGCMVSAMGLFCAVLAFASEPAQKPPDEGLGCSYYSGNFSFEAKAGSQRDLFESAAFIPLACTRKDLVFSDLRLKKDNLGAKEWNLGLGTRFTMDWNGVLGTYGYFDQKKSNTTGKLHNQATLGIEYIAAKWEARANGYFPLSADKYGTHAVPLVVSDPFLAGTGVFVERTQPLTLVERPMGGADFEFGLQVPYVPNLWAYAGGFSFDSSFGGSSIAGYRSRLNYDFTDNLALLAEGQWDNRRGTQGWLGARLTFHFGGEADPENTLKKRMSKPPVRDVDVMISSVATGDPTATTPILNEDSGEPQRVLYVDNTAAAGGDGSLENPFTTLAEAQTALTDYDAVYVFRGDGTATGQNAGFTIDKTGIKLIGSGSYFLYDGQKLTASASAAGGSLLLTAGPSAPLLTHTGTAAITLAAADAFVSGFSIDGAATYGVYVDNADNAFLDNLSVANSGADGLYVKSDQGTANGTFTARDIDSSGNVLHGLYATATGTGSGWTNFTVSGLTAIENDYGSTFVKIVGPMAKIDTLNLINITASGGSAYGNALMVEEGGRIGSFLYEHIEQKGSTGALGGGHYIYVTGTGSLIDRASISDVSSVENLSTGVRIQTSENGRIDSLAFEDFSALDNAGHGMMLYATNTGSIGALSLKNTETIHNSSIGMYLVGQLGGYMESVDIDTISTNDNNSQGMSVYLNNPGDLTNLVSIKNMTSNDNGQESLYICNYTNIDKIIVENVTASNNYYDFWFVNSYSTSVEEIILRNINISATTNYGGMTNDLEGNIGSVKMENIVSNDNVSYGIYNIFAGTVGSVELNNVTALDNPTYGIQTFVTNPGTIMDSLSLIDVTSSGGSYYGNKLYVGSGAQIGAVDYQYVDHAGGGGSQGAGIDIRVANNNASIGDIRLSNVMSLANTGTYGQGVSVLAGTDGSIASVTMDDVRTEGNVQQGILVQTATRGTIGAVVIDTATSAGNTNAGVQIQATGTGTSIASYELSNITSTGNTGANGRGVYVLSSVQGAIGDGEIDGATLSNNVAQGLYVYSATAGTIGDLDFKNIDSLSNGNAGVQIQATTSGSTIGDVSLTNILAQSNTGTSGRGAYIVTTAMGRIGDVTAQDIEVKNNTSNGFLLQASGTSTIGNIFMDSGTAQSNAYAGFTFNASGSGSSLGDIELSNLLMNSNTGGTYGRGLLVQADLLGAVGATTLSNLTATGNGAQGLYLYATTTATMGPVQMTDIIARENTSTGIYLQTTSGATINGITASSIESTANRASGFAVTASTFSSIPTFSISDALLQTNTGSTSRGLYVASETSSDIGSVSVLDVTASGNSSQGLYLYATTTGHIGSLTLQDSDLKVNAGGGFHALASGAGTIDDILVTTATADSNGNAGISLLATGTGSTIDNIEVTDVTALGNTTGNGIGILASVASAGTINNVTISDIWAALNSSAGVEIYSIGTGSIIHTANLSNIDSNMNNGSGGIGVYIYATGTSTIETVNLTDIHTVGNDQQGVNVTAGTGATINSATLTGVTSVINDNSGVYFYATTSGRIQNASASNVLSDANATSVGRGLYAYAYNGGIIENLDLSDIQANRNTAGGVHIVAAAGQIGDVDIDRVVASENASTAVLLNASGTVGSIATASLSDIIALSNTGSAGRGVAATVDTKGTIGSIAIDTVTATSNSQQGAYVYAGSGGTITTAAIDNLNVSQSANYGVQIYATGAGSTIDSVSLTNLVSGSNTTTSGVGAYVYAAVQGAVNSVLVDTATFSGNAAQGFALFATTSARIGDSTLQNITTTNNGSAGMLVYATTTGSAIGDTTIRNVTSTGNTGAYGRGIYGYADTAATMNSIIIDTVTANNNAQQGVYFYSTGNGDIGSVTMNNMTTSQNANAGVQIYATGAGSTVGSASLTNLISQSNTGSYGVGAYFNTAASGAINSILVDTVTTSGNTAQGINLYATSSGQIGDSTLQNISTTNNTNAGMVVYATTTGSAIGDTTIRNVTATGNTGAYGRGIYGYADTSATISSIVVDTATTSNNAQQGAYFYTSANGDIGSVSIDNLTTTQNANAGVQIYATGAGSTIGSASLTNLISQSNTGSYGIGAYFYAPSSGAINAILVDTATLSGNTQQGALLFATTSGQIGSAALQDISTTGNANAGVSILSTGTGSSVGATTLDNVLSSNNTGANGNGLYVNATANANITGVSLESFTSTGNSASGVYLDDDSAGSFVVDLGGGATGSTGQNRIFSNTGADLRVDLDGLALKAQSNWWGTALGLLAGETTLEVGSTVDSTNFLVADPAP